MLRRLPRKCKFLNLPFTKPELIIIGLNPEPPSTTFQTVSGGKFSPKVMHLLLKSKRPPPMPSPRSQRPLLSSIPSGRTLNNRSDGLNKELLMPRTSLTKESSTNLGKLVRPSLINGLPMSTKVD